MKNTTIFALSKNKKLTSKVCKILKVPVSKVKLERFADGEIIASADSSVRGKDAYVIQSLSNPVNESIMELLIFIDSLKRASANSITAIIPYLGYSRQDRKDGGRQPITSKLLANLISISGATKVMTFDLHAPQIQGFFDIPTDNLWAVGVLKKELDKLKLDNISVASPDYGGIIRARKLATLIGSNVGVCSVDKHRYEKNNTKVNNIFGNVEGKNIIIIDDMIDTAGSMINAANIFLEKGAKKIIVACTHPLFSKDALKRLSNSKISKIIMTDTIELEEDKLNSKFCIATISHFLAEAIKANQENRSISKIYQKYGLLNES